MLEITPKSPEEWREWLEQNHLNEDSVWVVMYKKNKSFPVMSWSDAVDVALCYGWIDSTRRPIDEFSFIQYYSKRKPKSNWSKINKAKVERLIKEGLMKEAGHKSIEIAKQNGSWTILDSIEALIVPEDLQYAFEENPEAERYYNGLSNSVRKMVLHRVTMAKRPETRLKRITEVVEKLGNGEKPI